MFGKLYRKRQPLEVMTTQARDTSPRSARKGVGRRCSVGFYPPTPSLQGNLQRSLKSPRDPVNNRCQTARPGPTLVSACGH